jgi:flagellar basal body-associated protein FliL
MRKSPRDNNLTKKKRIKRWIVWLFIYIFIIMSVLSFIICGFFSIDEKLCQVFVVLSAGLIQITGALAMLSMVDSSKKKDKKDNQKESCKEI